jgi:nitroreductase
MIKRVIKSLLGEKNISRIRAAISSWKSSGVTYTSDQDKTVSVLMSVHMLEKALVMGNAKYLNAIKYHSLIENISQLIESGASPEEFNIAGSVAIIKSALGTLSGHEDEKKELESLIARHNISERFRGGIERIEASEIFSHINFDFHSFVSSRHSVRRFKNKIVSREVIYDIIRDAEHYPSACNRQPCKVYFSENPETISRIIRTGADRFVAPCVHDCLIVTCDRALLLPAERNDQEYINGGIFLAYLVMSVHAHGLASCLFQFLQVASERQNQIRREFGIPESEVISAFLGIGEPEDEVICACAQRRPVEEIAVSLDE